MNNIFVGNLSFVTTKEELSKLFEPFGVVANVVIMERGKGKSRGFGFVEMPNEEEKNAAIAALDGKEFMWRVLLVSPVIPKVPGEVRPKKVKPAKIEWKPREGASSTERPRESKPWAKQVGGSKPYRRDDRESKPYKGKGTSATAKPPYKKYEASAKPWAKPEAGAKPYRRDDRSAKPFKSEGASSATRPAYKKPEGPSKPWVKKEGGFKSAVKPAGGFKMAHKVVGTPKSRPKRGPVRPV